MSPTKIGSWEIHTKGFGSKILTKYGWKKGKSIGKYSDGVIAPLFEVNGKFDEKPVKILKQIKNPRDEKRFHLINELDKLLLQGISSQTVKSNLALLRIYILIFADI